MSVKNLIKKINKMAICLTIATPITNELIAESSKSDNWFTSCRVHQLGKEPFYLIFGNFVTLVFN